MRGLSHFLAAIAVAGIIQALAPISIASSADVSCSSPDYVASLPAPPDGCHRVEITASGNERPTKIWARTSGLEHWRDQVINKYGERFAIWGKSACRKAECVPGAISGMTRCTYSAYPCSVKPPLIQASDTPDPDTETLSKDDILEMQRLLLKAGYTLKVDGLFGPKTERALGKWQRIRKFDDDGLPTMRNLELLRKYA